MNSRRVPEGIRVVSDPIPHVTVDLPTATGTIYLNGAHVAEWTPTDHQPVLFLSGDSWLEEGQPIRGGIPVCFPWFADGLDGTYRPFHGYARLAQWELTGAAVEDDVAHLEFKLPLDEVAGLPGAEPHHGSFDATVSVSMGRELTVLFSVSSDHGFVFEEALHTYFRVQDITQTRITGLDQAEYWDKVSRDVSVQSGDITFHGEFDRVYESTGSVQIFDDANARVITVDKTNSANTVVWNPWRDKTQDVSDLGAAEWASLVCVETANVKANRIVLAPGESHSMSVTISVASTEEV